MATQTADYPRDHEAWSARIVEECLSERLANHGANCSRVVQLIRKSREAPQIARDIIASQLDADRLDYLLRDSYAAGVPYGHYALDWLLRCLRVGQFRPHESDHVTPRLGFATPKAKAVVGQYILARQSMYSEVYMHKATRAFQALLHNIVGLASLEASDGHELPGTSPSLAKMLRKESLSVDEYLSLDDCVVWSAIVAWACMKGKRPRKLRAELRRKAEMLVGRSRPYRHVEIHMGSVKAAAELTVEARRDPMLSASLHYDEFGDVPYRNVFYKPVLGGMTDEGEEEHARPIYFIDVNGRADTPEGESKVIDQLSKVEIELKRLYYDASSPQAVAALRKCGLLGDSETGGE